MSGRTFSHAHVLGVSDDVSTLLRELACSGEPILFIDGIDKIIDPAAQLTVNDILKAIANEQSLSAWRVLVTVREQNLKHLETWLDADALKKLQLRTISVAPLFASPEWRPNARDDYLDREFASCALCTFFCVAPDFSPLICGVDPGWPHLGKFRPILERATREFGLHRTLYLGVTTFLKRGGFDILPEPALAWLKDIAQAKKQDHAFWQANGEDTVELLKRLIAEKSADLKPEHHRLVTLISDILIDNGVRGAGFLQQELLRAG